MRVAVFSTYDVRPGENGGEVRFLNIYRRLSRDHEVRILSYDFRGNRWIDRDRLEPALDTITARMSDSDRRLFYDANERTGLFTHDVLCIDGYDFTADFLRDVRKSVEWAEIVVVCCPFLATTIFPMCGPLQLKVYEAHNVEARAKVEYLSNSRDPVMGDELIAQTIRCEALALAVSDVILAVSERDADDFVDQYGVDSSKIRLVPNGVTVSDFDNISAESKAAFRQQAGLADTDVAVFLGSAYGPNVDSYRMARGWLDAAGFKGAVLIIGRIAEVYDDSWPTVGFTEHWLGFVDNKMKHLMVGAADFALQIITAGGGTNLKLFDYMAAGIPILANTFGIRGVPSAEWYVPVDSAEKMRDLVAVRGWRLPKALSAAAVAHDIAREHFDWGSIVRRYREALI